ncbi:hypothetical protein [Limnohabitans sp. DM1]|uniref:hypothetical protein n=1 Tax=Limnohabitans sp. DM1 TaxID=1597955 RepID=UPI0018929913|nr:hypothetical protein [Limnohabitans sp. DM1]
MSLKLKPTTAAHHAMLPAAVFEYELPLGAMGGGLRRFAKVYRGGGADPLEREGN